MTWAEVRALPKSKVDELYAAVVEKKDPAAARIFVGWSVWRKIQRDSAIPDAAKAEAHDALMSMIEIKVLKDG